MNSKVCKGCKLDKPLDAFYEQENGRLGRTIRCKICHDQKSQETKNKQRERYQNNREKLLAYQKEYNSGNKQKISAYQKIYSHENREKVNQHSRQFRDKNREQILAREKQYRVDNVEEIAEKHIHRKTTDPEYHLRICVGDRIRKAIKHHPTIRAGSSIELIGCTIKELMVHLEELFIEGMSWDNYGREKGMKCWEMDHIIPCSSFNLTIDSEQFKCFNYQNLQPLWAEDNNAKRIQDNL